jgi:hypothetical protein
VTLNKRQLDIIARDPKEFFAPLKRIEAVVEAKRERIEWWRSLQAFQPELIETHIGEIGKEIDEIKVFCANSLDLIQSHVGCENQKEILLLRFFEGLKIKDISDYYSIGYREAQRWLQRALHAFQIGVLTKYEYSQNASA